MVNVDKTRLENLKNIFYNNYNDESQDIFSSPGRIEICGNHTDHNNGLVLVGAIDCDMLAVAAPDKDIKIMSIGYPSMQFSIKDLSLKDSEAGTSIAMVKGVLQGFKNYNLKIGGFKMVMDSRIFKGAGVSSSAAFELLICEIVNRYYNEDVDRITLAKIGQYAENTYFLKPSGLLDQSGISLGGVCKIDFRNEPIVEKLNANFKKYEIVIVNTGDHSNLTEEYTKIRTDMGLVAGFFNKKVLREVDKDEFYQKAPELAKTISGRAILRAMHYFEENDRVVKASAALESGDTATFLETIKESGLSSIMYLQNTTYASDREQRLNLALKISANIIKDGAVRVHGGGFAGTIIAFLADSEVENYVSTMSDIFGSENVLNAKVRTEGATKL